MTDAKSKLREAADEWGNGNGSDELAKQLELAAIEFSIQLLFADGSMRAAKRLASIREKMR